MLLSLRLLIFLRLIRRIILAKYSVVCHGIFFKGLFLRFRLIIPTRIAVFELRSDVLLQLEGIEIFCVSRLALPKKTQNFVNLLRYFMFFGRIHARIGFRRLLSQGITDGLQNVILGSRLESRLLNSLGWGRDHAWQRRVLDGSCSNVIWHDVVLAVNIVVEFVKVLLAIVVWTEFINVVDRFEFVLILERVRVQANRDVMAIVFVSLSGYIGQRLVPLVDHLRHVFGCHRDGRNMVHLGRINRHTFLLKICFF